MARIRHLALNPADESSTNIPRRARGSIIHGPATRRAAVVAFIFCALAITLALVPHRGRQATALVWEADFNGRPGAAPSAQQWDVIRGGGGWGHHELQTYDPGPHTVALTGSGLLGITAQRSTSAATDAVTYSSGRVESRTFRLSGAVVSARLRTPPGQGLWPAFWLSSEAPDHPATVELDAMEAIGRQPRTLYGTAHFGTLKRGAGLMFARPLSDGFHVYSVEWTPRLIRFSVDRRVYDTILRSSLPSRAAWPSDRPMHIILNLAVGGDWPGPPSRATPFPAHMFVAWVRVDSLLNAR